MSRRHALPLVMLLAVPCQAPLAQSPGGDPPPGAMQAFFRLAERLGQRRSEFRAVWPLSLQDGASNTSIALTASDRLSVHFADDPVARDTTPRVAAVILTQQFADTLSLRNGVLALQRALEQKYGPPDECSDPLGPPAHLFSPQTVSRFWKRALGAAPLHLTWEVSPTRAYVLSVYAGRFAAPSEARMSCEAKLP
ncbi:MAG: hypothetical protein V4813_04210 [Gemmatimonadota bacterium]